MVERFETFTVLLNRINRNIRKIKNAEMANYELKSPHISCLYYLYRAENLTSKELCERCEEDKATISRSLDYLEKNGYIICKSDSKKRYNAPFELTERGRRAGKRIADKISAILNGVSSEISSNNLETFYHSLNIISDNIDGVAKSYLGKGKKIARSKEIPIFFSTDDNYVPFLDVAISSLIENASGNYKYKIIVLNTGLKQENIDLVKKNETDRFSIEFFDISNDIEFIKSHFKNVYHFSIVTYYRLFIASLFPKYDKILYLDCDLVVNGDISELYNTDLGDNILGAVADAYVSKTPEFRLYAEKAIGVNPDTYFNAGVLVINLEQFRKQGIEEKFIKLITEFNFDLLDPDQAYLNYLCYNRVKLISQGWNKVPSPLPFSEKKNIVHYALYKKPWQYDDVPDGDIFWHYAKKSPFYNKILEVKNTFDDVKKKEKEAASAEILEHAKVIVASGQTFSNLIQRS